MNLKEIWASLVDAQPVKGAGHLQRRLFPEGGVELFAVVKRPGNRKTLRLHFEGGLPSGTSLPDCRGLSLTLEEESAVGSVIEIASTTPLYDDIYYVLCADLAEKLGHVAIAEAPKVLIEELERWQRFLSTVGAEGLGEEGQQGLFGELHFIKELLLSTPDIDRALRSWTAPGRGIHDFQLPGLVCEVKTIATKAHHRMRIPSEKQLDGSQARTLVYCLMVTPNRSMGRTLPDLVADVRAALAPAPGAAQRFEDGLFRWGYLDMHEPRYRDLRYTIVSESVFEVLEGFPRITSKDLRPGVGDVSYSITLAACESFRRKPSDARQAIAEALTSV
jgi:hypothetical protein